MNSPEPSPKKINRTYLAKQYFILALPSKEKGQYQILAPDFKIETKVNLLDPDILPKWLSHLILETQDQMNRILLNSKVPHPRPKTLKVILSKGYSRRSPKTLAKSFGVTDRTIRLHNRSSCPPNLGEFPFDRIPSSHFDYPIVIGPLNKTRGIFIPDLKVSKTLDPTLSLEAALSSAFTYVMHLAKVAFSKLDPKPPISFLRHHHEVSPPDLEWLTSSEFARELRVSAKTVLRKYRHLGQETPGGHMRWLKSTALTLKVDNSK